VRLVIVESPYAGNREQNVAYARAAMLDCLKRGEAPMVPHLLYTQVLDDTVIAERALGIRAGTSWYYATQACIVYEDLGISNGMSLGIIAARKHDIPIEYRQLNDPNVPIGERIWKPEVR
jgi:hypothetical protein